MMLFWGLIGVTTGMVWMLLAARWVSVFAVAAAAVIVGYVLGYDFWHVRLGPLPVTVDRLLMLMLIVLAAYRLWQRQYVAPLLTWIDWVFVTTLGWLTLSAVIAQVDSAPNLPTSPFWRLLFSFWLPAVLYLAVRISRLTSRQVTYLLGALAVLGSYLAITAFAEVSQQWWLVFPKFIADPDLGTHFGRARGPALNSVSLGSYLGICFWACWFLRSRVARGWQIVLLIAMMAIACAVLLTYTRSAWLGLALSGLIVLLIETPRQLRWPVLLGTAAVGAILAVSMGTSIVQLEREDSGQVSEHSVHQRKAFAYVSWKMFCDDPVTGVGFGRFYDKKLPYLADRSQAFELESLRGLHHHNTFLSLLVETGLVGLVGYLALLGGWAFTGWQMACSPGGSIATQQMGRLLLACGAIYLPSALFHDISLIFQDQWLVFLIAGVCVACGEQAQLARVPLVVSQRQTGAQQPTPLASPLVPRRLPQVTPRAAKITLFGIQIDRLNLRQAADQILDWTYQPLAGACRYVVTPNVNHAVLLSHHHGLQQSYQRASLILADGAPIVALSRMLGKALPGRVTGSDLVPELLRLASRGPRPLRVFLLGAGPGVAQRAATNIRRQYPGVEIVGTHCPPMGFEHDEAANRQAIAAVAAAQPDLLVLGLGAPKQELWVHAHADQLQAKVAVCAGATIDFLAGEKARSPRWMQQVGLEWLHRVLTEPRRLARRYWHDGLRFPLLVWNEWRGIYS